MRKKFLFVLILAMLTTTVSLSGCGSDEKTSHDNKQEDDREREDDEDSGLKSFFDKLGKDEATTESDTPETESTPEAESTPVTEVTPETEVIPETESLPETEATPESEWILENEILPEDEPLPEEAGPNEEEIQADILADLDATFLAALDHIVPDKELTPASMVSNAILQNTTYVINSITDNFCSVTVKYPNVAPALLEAMAALPEDATDEQMDEALKTLAAKITDGEIELSEKTFDLEIIDMGGMRTISWTPELYDAFTGGLYTIE